MSSGVSEAITAALRMQFPARQKHRFCRANREFLKIVLVLVVVLVLDLAARGFPAPPAVSMPTTSATRTIIPDSKEAESPSNAEVSKQRLKEWDERLAR